MGKRFYHGAALLSIIGLCVVAWVGFTTTINLSNESTTATQWWMEVASTPSSPVAGTNIWGVNPHTITYSASNNLYWRVVFTQIGYPTPDYMVQISMDGGSTWQNATLDGVYTGYMEFSWIGSWSSITHVRLASNQDTSHVSGVVQRPSSMGE